MSSMLVSLEDYPAKCAADFIQDMPLMVMRESRASQPSSQPLASESSQPSMLSQARTRNMVRLLQAY